jgi:hypothetical protein
MIAVKLPFLEITSIRQGTQLRLGAEHPRKSLEMIALQSAKKSGTIVWGGSSRL